jgi:TRAP-type C4-dicarboxylate transport system permease small subunit
MRFLGHGFLHYCASREMGSTSKYAFGVYGDLFIALVILLMNIVVSRFLFRRRIFLRV